MRIDAFLAASPMFAVHRAARRFDAVALAALAEDGIGFMEALVLAAIFFEEPEAVKPSQLAAVFGTTRGSISHSVSALEARGWLARKIDANDARAYQLTLKPQGRRAAMRVIGVLDGLQRGFERTAGKAALADALKVLAKLED